MTTTLATIAERRNYGSATDFMNSLADQLARKGRLTARQVAAAEKIIARGAQIAAQPARTYSRVEPGYYLLNDAPVVVVESKSSGRTYAKRLVLPEPGSNERARWEYAAGAVFDLAGQSPVTIEQAISWGHLHGYCIKCGVVLDDPASGFLSVQAGIGPVCVKKLFGITQTQLLARRAATAAAA
jgi:hypothetical protein